MVKTLIRYVQHPLTTTLPPPVIHGGWEGYCHIMHYEGERPVDVH